MATQPSDLGGWGANNTQDPGATKKATGFLDAESPPYQYFNWFWNLCSNWFAYLNAVFTGGSAGDVVVIGADGFETQTASALVAAAVAGPAYATLRMDGSAAGVEAPALYVEGTAAITMSADTPYRVLFTQAAAITQALPTTGVKKGQSWKFCALDTTSGRNVTFNSSGGDLVWVMCPGNECEIMALQDTPTTAAHWRVINRGWPICARIHKTSNQGFNESTATKITFDAAASDPAGMFQNGNDRLVLPMPGRWRVKGQVLVDGLTGGNDQATNATIYFNGTQHVNGGYGGKSRQGDSNPWDLCQVFAEFLTTAVTDYVELYAYYTDNVGVNAGIANQVGSFGFLTPKCTFLEAEYLGPI